MNNDYVVIERSDIEGMLQYIEDEIKAEKITPKMGKGIIENLINNEGITDLKLQALIDEYIDIYESYI